MLLKELSKEGERLTYSDMGHLLMTGALWEDQIATDADLPSKGEEMIAVFWLREKYLCVQHHTYTQKTAGYLPYSSESMDEINEFEQIT
jgi:hypothetical protein